MSECRALEQLVTLDDKEANAGGIKEWTKKLKNKLDAVQPGMKNLLDYIESLGSRGDNATRRVLDGNTDKSAYEAMGKLIEQKGKDNADWPCGDMWLLKR